MLLFVLILVGVFGYFLYWLFMSPNAQLFGSFPYRAETNEKLVALTFDDGPNPPHTENLLKILKDKGVLATFFVVGDNVRKYPEIVKKIDRDGHIVGNHSLSHKFSKYFMQPNFKKEIQATQQIIYDSIGKNPALFRPPWLFRTPVVLGTVRRMGLRSVSGYFCNSKEIFQPDSSKIAASTLEKVKPGSIIIFHDGFDAKGGNRAETVKAVAKVIDELKKHGYKFTTVDKLLQIPAYL